MTSKVICLSGRGPALSASFHPEIELDEQYDYSCCLLDLSIETSTLKAELKYSNNLLSVNIGDKNHSMELPTGEHEIDHIAHLIEEYVHTLGSKVSFWLDKRTMTYVITTDPFLNIDFTVARSVGSVFGFGWQSLHGNMSYTAPHSLGNLDVETIRVNCDLVNASFHDGIRSHVLHEFHPNEISNYKMIEQPHTLIYLPIARQSISAVNLTVTDQDGKRIDILDGRHMICRINIKRE